jgi:hypothetical protein
VPTTVACSNYTYTSGTGSIVPGTTDVGNHCDDCSVPITLPFPVNLYEGTFTNATLSSNGNMQFVTTDFAFGNACLPVPIFEYGIVAYWDDLITDCDNCGIFTSVTGSAPNRIFNVEWRAEVLGEQTTPANFEIRLYEGQTKFDLVYGTVLQLGNGATIGVQRDLGASTQFECNSPGSVTPNLLLSFTLAPCGNGTTTTPTPPTKTPTRTTTTGTATATSVPTACSIEFQDVPPSAEEASFYPFVRCLACRGIIGGYPCGSTNPETGQSEPCGNSNNPYYRPSNQITRGQISKVVAGASSSSGDPGPQKYEDVPPGSPFFTWINRLSNEGVMGGYPCGGPGEPCQAGNRPYFRPNANATRGQMSKIVANAAGFDEAVTGQSFEDLPPDNSASSYYPYVGRLFGRGVVGGYPCGGAGEECGPESRP